MTAPYGGLVRDASGVTRSRSRFAGSDKPLVSVRGASCATRFRPLHCHPDVGTNHSPTSPKLTTIYLLSASNDAIIFLPAGVLYHRSRFIASERVLQISVCNTVQGLFDFVDFTSPALCRRTRESKSAVWPTYVLLLSAEHST